MRITTKGRYGIRAVINLAMAYHNRPISISAIAEQEKVSSEFLEQIFFKLKKAGLIRSVRGPGGGYVLGRDADAISIGEVMAAVDEPVRMTRCLSEGDGCVSSRRCNTHFLWDALGTHIEQFLATATLADVLHGRYSAPVAGISLSELAAAAKVGS